MLNSGPHDTDAAALRELIETAYTDMKGRVKAEASLTKNNLTVSAMT